LRGRLCGAMSILIAVSDSHHFKIIHSEESVSGLGAREADGGAIVIEVRASALFECLGGWIDDAHACEVVC
jgi:hypothetical protein